MTRPWRLEIWEREDWHLFGSYATKENAERMRDGNWGLEPDKDKWRIRPRDGWQQ